MLEGLEAVEIKFLQVIFGNQVFRIDSQYFKKKYLLDDLNIHKFPIERLGNLAFITDGQHGYHEVDDASPIRHLTAKNASGWFANDHGADRIASWVDENNQRSSLQKDDLILSTRGTVGCCAIVDADVLPANIDQDVARIKIENPVCSATTLLAFLNSSIGQDWMERNQTGMVQQGLALCRVREMPIPIFSINFQSVIDRIIVKSKQNISSSKAKYNQAETTLLNMLGLADFSPSTEAINIKSLKDSFATTGRLDAEYYQRKYEEYQSIMLSYPNGWQLLMQVCNIKDSNFTPDDSVEYNYIELADIDNSGAITGCTTSLGSELPSRARRIVTTGDVLISSIEGSLSSCAIILENMDAALCSTGFYVIHSDEINSETLLVLFKSTLMQNILKQRCTGTILTAINRHEFQNITVPIIAGDAQKKITGLVQKSFSLKAESERLLDVAKRAVEIAIEQDENAGMSYIEMNS